MIEKKNNFRIEYTKGDTYALKIIFKNIEEDLTAAFFTVKENIDDEPPLIEKTIDNGISKIEPNSQIAYKLQLQAEDSRNLQPDFLYLYDLKVAVGNVIKTVISGNFVVTHNVTGVDRITNTLADIDVDDVIETDASTTPATRGIEYEQDPVAMAKIGDITDLETQTQADLVSAINEVNAKATAGLDGVQAIEDGSFKVPSAADADTAVTAQTCALAQIAAVATYASADHTKGTIEQRLTALGFRQGSITLPSGVTAATNIVKRQGNYVIGNLQFTMDLLSPRPTWTGTIPPEFRPTEQIVFGGYTTDSAGGYIVIFPNGDVVYTQTQSYVQYTMTINFGYEADPIQVTQ